MPVPFIFIGIAAITGAAGVGTTVKAGVDQSHATSINKDANQRIEESAKRLDFVRKQCGDALQSLGEEKVFVLNNGINEFITNFQKIKNVDFSESEGILELKRLRLDQKEFAELAEMTKFSLSLVQGGITGVAGGALAAFGAYSAATAFATASTGTAIASLSGVAASNATLAFFGGGSLAAGGLGMAGGTAVLGGLVAGPALLVMGIISSAKAGKNLQEAYANEAKANEICEELQTASEQCIAIRRRSHMFYSLLAKLDAYLYPLNEEMKRIISEEGTDYSKYSQQSKQSIAAVVSTVASIKTVLDTTILTESGEITDESEKMVMKMIE
ncbi:MAG: hypothetical protein IKH28_14225 [Lachnospiraceae bacterium]|nr:hypothetical protein [Lachnospiraceae bacterium]